MSTLSRRPLTRARQLGLLTAGLVITGALAAFPIGTAAGSSAAEPARSGSTAASGATRDLQFADGRYVVLLREPAAVRYNGSKERFAATRAKGGQQFRSGTQAVRDYTAHLRSTHRQVADSVGARPVRSYSIAANGFAAELSAEQAVELSQDRRVLVVERDIARKVDTWNTPGALGLSGKNGVWEQNGGRAKAGAGVVVGIIDSGIWPESKSFNGLDLTAAPRTKWDVSMDADGHTRMEKKDGGVFTGACEAGEEFTTDLCNSKLISARFYADAFIENVAEEDWSEYEVLSPRDSSGHGTHVASTAAGKRVDDVETETVKFGTVSGMAPAAKIAAYKVCWEDSDPDTGGCFTSASLAAIDDAVADGVDVINFSISGAQESIIDPVEFAFEGAAEAGVFVATSAGNSGPTASSVAHNSPWLTTVAAATHYAFENTLVLGNGQKIVGASISKQALASKRLVDSEDIVVAGGDAADAALCGPDTLDPAQAAGAIVVCTRGVYDRVAKSAEVARAGGVAMVLANPSENSLDADFHAVPTVHISVADAEKVFAYLDSAGSTAKAAIKLGNLTNQTTPVPQVAGFSSRGPAASSDSDLLKPDIIAPGASVLAAVAPPSNFDRDYDLYSGTSMSSPHIAGLAGFMMGVNPGWSAQQVKSAMMTTATSTRTAEDEESGDGFGQGAGLVNPKRFLDPGLFVTSTPREWLGFISDQGVDTGVAPVAGKDINLPSMAQGQVTSSTSFTRSFVSSRPGSWKVSVDVPGFTATLSRSKVVAKRAGDIESLTIDFTRSDAALGEFSQGFVTLTGPTTVRLPVALRPVSVKAPATVTGTGTSGSVDVPITAGFTGLLDVGVHGLAKATTVEDSVAVGADHFECVEVSDTAKVAKFDLDATDDTSDLDLYVYAADSCDIETAFAEVGLSATGAADESVTLFDPEPGFYIADVNGYSAGESGDPIGFRLDTYVVDDGTTLGNFTATPNPVPVVNSEETTFEVSWSDLEAGARYLGLLEYDGALAPTLVEVSTLTP